MSTATGRRPVAAPAVVRVRAIGTEAVMAVADAEMSDAAEQILRHELDAIDRTCSRFRPDAEIGRLHRRPGTWVEVSPLLFAALASARQVACHTGGAVDPTVGDAMERLGYDRDFAVVDRDGPPTAPCVPAPGWRHLELDPIGRRARLAPGVRLDLGATAKALVADRAAAVVAALGTGTVVSIGGDVAIAGRPPLVGWTIGIAGDSASTEIDEVVSMSGGGLATSSTELRSWRRGARRVHHIVDPTTGDCASAVWRMVTVAGGSCVDANAASTASVVWGEQAPARLQARRLAARLVRHDGVVVTTPGWPAPRPRPGPDSDGAAP